MHQLLLRRLQGLQHLPDWGGECAREHGKGADPLKVRAAGADLVDLRPQDLPHLLLTQLAWPCKRSSLSRFVFRYSVSSWNSAVEAQDCQHMPGG